MAKPKATVTKKKAVSEPNDPKFNNSLSSAVGYNDGMSFNGGPEVGGSQLSQTATQFKTLRGYLISNMRTLLSQLYVEIGLVQTIIDVPVDDALRGWVEIRSKQLSEEQLKLLQNFMKKQGDPKHMAQAKKWTRLYGGGALIIITEQDPESPLELSLINKDSKVEFRAVDMWELYYDKQMTQDYEPKVGSVDTQMFTYYGQKLHPSRVIKMKGLEAPSFIRPRLMGWGFSVCEKLVRGLNQYLKATDLSFEVMDEFKLDVYRFKNLASTLMSPTGDSTIRKRIALANWQKNYQSALVMDSEDEFDHKQLSFSGLAEVMQGIRMQVASEMRMPLTKIFGLSSAGFNSGEDDIEVYNAMVESEVRTPAEFDILKMVEIRCQQMFSIIPDDLSIAFKPLRVMSSADEETVKTSKFNRLLAAKSAGEIDSFEFREGINKGELLDITLDLDKDMIGLDTEGVDDENPDDENEDDNKDDKPDKKENSIEYDRASYEADGGDAMFPDGRERFYPEDGIGGMNIDRGIWQKAKEACEKAYGSFNWKFTLWKYRTLGGKSR